MTLQQYLVEKQVRPSAFAAAIGVAPSTITRILRGERRPRLDLIESIRRATDGQVTASDFLSSTREAAA